MKYFICLLGSHWRGEDYERGDIITPPTGTAPPALSWASFTPPAGLRGAPTLTHVEDPGTGDLTFRFSLKAIKKNLVLRARIGLPEAIACLEGTRHVKDGTGPPAPAGKPQLSFGAGSAATSGRGLVAWNSQQTPTPPKPVEYDPWAYDNGRDPLGRDYLK